MSTALASGHFPPRWMPDAAYGLGYPFWNYYAPLAYVGTAIVSLLGGGAVGAIKVWQLLWFALAALGAHKLGVRMWGTVSAGVLTAVAYTVAPYHMSTCMCVATRSARSPPTRFSRGCSWP